MKKTISFFLLICILFCNLNFSNAYSIDNKYPGEYIGSLNGISYYNLSEDSHSIVVGYDSNNILVERSDIDLSQNEILFNLNDNIVNSVQDVSKHILGHTVYDVKTGSSYYRSMLVEYEESTLYNQNFTIPNIYTNSAKLINKISIIFGIKKLLALEISKFLLEEGLVHLGTESVILYFTVKATKTHQQYYGSDGPYYGTMDGVKWVVSQVSSKYYNKVFYDDIYIEPSEWGNGHISAILGPIVYGGYYNNLSYNDEGR